MQKLMGAFSWTLLVIATVAFGYVTLLVPSWRGEISDICHLGVLGGDFALLAIWAVKWRGRSFRLEQSICAVFLGLMPLVYVIRCWIAQGGTTNLLVEIFGFLIFGSLAILGYKRSPWLLATGIVAHGFSWDAVHLAMKTTYMPSWYETACWLADATLGAYLAARILVWQSGRRSAVAQASAGIR